MSDKGVRNPVAFHAKKRGAFDCERAAAEEVESKFTARLRIQMLEWDSAVPTKPFRQLLTARRGCFSGPPFHLACGSRYPSCDQVGGTCGQSADDESL